MQFEASTGFFLRGKVTPAVEGVKIDLVDMKTRISRQTVVTNEQGTYKVNSAHPYCSERNFVESSEMTFNVHKFSKVLEI